MQSKKKWFLRKKDGSEYGPVSLNDLLRWSAQCRIVAGNAVSMDREEWISVEDIPELEMHWMAHRADGKEYGPFALAAVQELFAHNVLPADAVLINRLTGENKPLADVIALPDADEPNADGGEQALDPPSGDQTADDGTTEDETVAEPEATNEAEHAAPETGEGDLTDRDGLVDRDYEADEADCGGVKDVAPLLAQIEALRQELLDAQTETAESGEAYLVKNAIMEKKLQNAQQAARDTAARLEALAAERQETQQQAGDDLSDLRKQTAFMKKNIAALHAELEEARRQSVLRARIVMALGSLLTLIAALFIIRSVGGCRQREDIGATRPPDRTDTSRAAAGESRETGAAKAASAVAVWPSLRIDGLRVEKKQDHLLIRFDEGAFGSLTTLTPAAAGQLKALVEQLRPQLQAYRLVVEGHADNIPMRATTAFADNAALAAARAETGAAYLKREGAHAIAATSTGPPPYPNDTPNNRRRNRTLVIKVFRQ